MRVFLCAWWGFPGDSSGKEPASQCLRCKRCGFDALGWEDPLEGCMEPTPVFLPGESRDRGAWRAMVNLVTKSWTWLNRSDLACMRSAWWLQHPTKDSVRLLWTDIRGQYLQQQVSPHAAPHPTPTAGIYSLGCTHQYSQYTTYSLWPAAESILNEVNREVCGWSLTLHPEASLTIIHDLFSSTRKCMSFVS